MFSDNLGEVDHLKKTAPLFFGDLCNAFRDYIFLQICVLTDPPEDHRGNENITIEFFLRNPDCNSERILFVANRMRDFRKVIKPARDKLISHNDRTTSQAGERLGAADMKAWNQFWIDLQEFVYFLSEQYLGQQNVQINAIASTDLPVLAAAVKE